MPLELRERLSNIKTGKKLPAFTEEHKAKIKEAMKGKRFSEEHKQKLREARKKYFAEGGKVWHAGKTGLYKPTEETKRKMSLAQTGKVITEEWANNISLAKRGKLMGELASNWKGGKTPLNKHLRNSANYREWKAAVFKRDEKTCQHCGKIEKEMDAHHIIEMQKIIDKHAIKSLEQAFKTEELWDINNGITLCKPCHWDVHFKKNLNTI